MGGACAERGHGAGVKRQTTENRGQGTDWPRYLVGALALLAVIAPQLSFGQEPAVLPAVAQVSDQPEDEVEPPPVVDGIPELPDTIVPGRLGAFPSEPLPGDSVVSPNLIPTPTNQTGSSVTVIEAEEIAASGQATVAEVLRGRLGLDVVRQGGPGGVTSVFLRGANSQHTKVLLDGIPLNDPSNATRGFDFSTLLTNNIERIEILRGPQSMVYGSDAIGGVINIITARGEGPLAVTAMGYGGSFQTGQTGLNVAGGDDVKYYSVSGAFLSTGGISAASVRLGNTEQDSFNIGNVNGRVGYDLQENWNVDYVFRYTDAAAKIDDFDFFSGLPVDNLLRKNLTKNWANRIQLTNWLADGLIMQRLGFNFVDYDRTATFPGPFDIPNFHGQTRELTYFAAAQVLDTNIVSAGANYLAEDAATTFQAQQHQNISGVFVQDEFQIVQNFYGTAGYRWDDASRAGPAETYRFTGLYRLDDYGTAFHGTIGTGFRQPALAENLFQFGNPNLLPERSKGWDIGGRQTIWEGVAEFDATYYRNDFQDLIVFDFNTFSLQNVGRARSSGVELSLLCYITPDLWINANYTSDDPLNLDTGTLLLRRPRDKAAINLTQAFPDYGASVTLQMLYVGDRLDTNNQILDEYTLLNLMASAQLTERLQAVMRLDNLTDQFYEEVRGFGTPGFAAYGGLTMVY
jgi:vitamin B12 transporter